MEHLRQDEIVRVAASIEAKARLRGGFAESVPVVVANYVPFWWFELAHVGPPVVPCYPFFGEGSPTKIDYRKKLVPVC